MSESSSSERWRELPFDEIVRPWSTTGSMIPSTAGVERYVGLEHLDSGDHSRIRRWGSPSDVEATKLRFRAGRHHLRQRRVYQRKLAVADFDGICSGACDGASSEARRRSAGVPAVLHAERLFMERAKEISVGSLSPTINWKTSRRRVRAASARGAAADRELLLAHRRACWSATRSLAALRDVSARIELLRYQVRRRRPLTDAVLDCRSGELRRSRIRRTGNGRRPCCEWPGS